MQSLVYNHTQEVEASINHDSGTFERAYMCLPYTKTMTYSWGTRHVFMHVWLSCKDKQESTWKALFLLHNLRRKCIVSNTFFMTTLTVALLPTTYVVSTVIIAVLTWRRLCVIQSLLMRASFWGDISLLLSAPMLMLLTLCWFFALVHACCDIAKGCHVVQTNQTLLIRSINNYSCLVNVSCLVAAWDIHIIGTTIAFPTSETVVGCWWLTGDLSVPIPGWYTIGITTSASMFVIIFLRPQQSGAKWGSPGICFINKVPRKIPY